MTSQKKKTVPRLFIFLLLGVVLALLAGFFLGKEQLTILLTDKYVTKIDKEFSSLRKFHVTIYVAPNVPAETDAHDKNGEVKKLFALFLAEDFQIEREHYFDKGKLRFVHEIGKSRDERLQDFIKTEENWFYFDNDKMILWLTGSKKEKKSQDDAYSEQEQDIVVTSQELLTGIAPRLAWKRKDPIPLASFLPRKVFQHLCEMSTERGTFEPDGRLSASRFDGFAYVDPRIGTWEIDGEKLIISQTALVAIGTFRDLLFEEKEGNTIAYHDRDTCSIEIAKDYETLEAFDKTHVWFDKNDSIDEAM